MKQANLSGMKNLVAKSANPQRLTVELDRDAVLKLVWNLDDARVKNQLANSGVMETLRNQLVNLLNETNVEYLKSVESQSDFDANGFENS